MAKVTKSQWEFDDLFPAAAAEQEKKILSVGEFTSQLRRLLEKEFKEVRVSGEVSNCKTQASGHVYFVLKDASAQLSCVLFRGEAQVDRQLIEDGRKLVVKGQITVYEPRGNYQLRVNGVELQGVGSLQAAFEKLKAKLKAEGLFDAERKRVIPRFPVRIGIVTSPTGAAIRDVLHVIERRNPSLKLILAPCRVQGNGAAAEIAAGVHMLNEFHKAECAKGKRGKPLDAILVTRGGGSLEDLWPFNEEIVARAIYNSALPVVSAVGHEIDFTISDFVADFRAATPSAAAEILTEGVFASCQMLSAMHARLRQLARRQLSGISEELERTLEGLQRVHPRRILEQLAQRVDDAVNSMGRCTKSGLKQHRTGFQTMAARFGRVRPAAVIAQRGEVLGLQMERLAEAVAHGMRERKHRFESASGKLRLLGPSQVLARGYSITTEAASGAIVRDPAGVREGTRLRSIVQKGEIFSQAERPVGRE